MFISRNLNEKLDPIRTINFWYNGRILDNFYWIIHSRLFFLFHRYLSFGEISQAAGKQRLRGLA